MGVKSKSSNREWRNAPEGLHKAVCCDIVDQGMISTKFGTRHMVQVRWQVDEINPDNGERFLVTKRYNNTLTPGSNLRTDIESWFGKALPEECEMDLDVLLGRCCQLQLVHEVKEGGKVYCNVKSIVPLSKEQSRLEVENYIRAQDRPDYKGPDVPAVDKAVQERLSAAIAGSSFDAPPDSDIPF